MRVERAFVKRVTVHYTGRVQGVGFRYTTVNVAKRFAVAGYVQNLPDGRVLLVAEGEAEVLRGLVAGVAQAMGSHINTTDMVDSVATGEFGKPGAPDAFVVRH